MKKMKFPAVVTALAVLGFGLRYLVYRTAVDEKNLITAGHPAVIALWVLTAAALALAAFGSRKQQKSGLDYQAHAPAFLGHGMLGAAILLTVCLNPLPMPGLLGLVWKLLGLAAPVCLLLSGCGMPCPVCFLPCMSSPITSCGAAIPSLRITPLPCWPAWR